MSFIARTNKHQKSNIDPIDLNEVLDFKINKPGRYIGNELGVKQKNWTEAKVHWVLSYPELYEVGASNLGHIILYSILNNIPGQLCDRVYLPGTDLAIRLRELSKPLFAVESQRAINTFDIIGFSLSYELGATNILEMLDLSNISIYASDRGDLSINHPKSPPLIFAGGPTATSNPEPYAKFFDFIALGDGEELLPEIGLVLSEAKEANLTRSECLLDLSNVPGIYVPSLFKESHDKVSLKPIHTSVSKKVLRRVANPIPHYGMGLVPNIETIHDRLTIEIRRGCTRGCRFCQPGMLTRPARDVEPNEVIDAVETGMIKTGYSDFSLLSLSCSDYLSLPAVGVELRNRLADKNITLQLPSQRVDRFDDDIAHILGGARRAGLTFAPEAGTQRLRDIINKGLNDQDLLNGIRSAMKNGFKKIKLYFMIGLPGERNSDVLGIPNTCNMLQKECQDLGRLHLNITISNFTPKPHTPFQWHSVSKTDLENKQELLKSKFKQLRHIKVNFTDTRISAMEDFVGRGDRDLAPVIEAAWKAGAGMDAWFESLERTYKAWTKAITQAGLEGRYRKTELSSWNKIESMSPKELKDFCSKPLPWDHIDTGIEKTWLATDLQRALQEKVIDDCSFGGCSNCGVCGPELGQNVIISAPEIPIQKEKQSPPTKRICKIRLSFAKKDSMRLLSHLDIVRLLERALRRSNLPISYTGGFHPLPRIEIALALPLGVEAFREWMEIEFTKQIDSEEVRVKLQQSLPKGLELTTAQTYPITKESLSKQVKGAIWSFKIIIDSQPQPTLLEWEQALEYIQKKKNLIWHDTDKKGRPRHRDCRPSLVSLNIHNEVPKSIKIQQFNEIRLELETLIDSMGRSLKPTQIKFWIEEYFKHPATITDIRRDELLLFQC